MKFGDTKTEKCNFHQQCISILINNIDINKIVISYKVSFGKKGFKYYIRYNDGKKVRSLCILLPGMNTYKIDFDKAKYMCFLIKHDEIWEKVSNSIKERFDSESVFSEKYLKTKIKSYKEKLTKFSQLEMPERSHIIWPSTILIDSVYPQVFLEECIYVLKEKKMPEYITENKEIYSDDSN